MQRRHQAERALQMLLKHAPVEIEQSERHVVRRVHLSRSRAYNVHLLAYSVRSGNGDGDSSSAYIAVLAEDWVGLVAADGERVILNAQVHGGVVVADVGHEHAAVRREQAVNALRHDVRVPHRHQRHAHAARRAERRRPGAGAVHDGARARRPEWRLHARHTSHAALVLCAQHARHLAASHYLHTRTFNRSVNS